MVNIYQAIEVYEKVANFRDTTALTVRPKTMVHKLCIASVSACNTTKNEPTTQGTIILAMFECTHTRTHTHTTLIGPIVPMRMI